MFGCTGRKSSEHVGSVAMSPSHQTVVVHRALSHGDGISRYVVVVRSSHPCPAWGRSRGSSAFETPAPCLGPDSSLLKLGGMLA